MSEENKEAEAAKVEQPSEPVKEQPQPAPQPAKPKPTPPKNVTIVLTGAGSYNDLNLKLGTFRKNQPVSLSKDKADLLLKTGLFKSI